MKAVHKHTPVTWVQLYIERWLKAKVILPGGTVQQRDKGTPSSRPASPLVIRVHVRLIAIIRIPLS